MYPCSWYVIIQYDLIELAVGLLFELGREISVVTVVLVAIFSFVTFSLFASIIGVGVDTGTIVQLLLRFAHVVSVHLLLGGPGAQQGARPVHGPYTARNAASKSHRITESEELNRHGSCSSSFLLLPVLSSFQYLFNPILFSTQKSENTFS